MSVTVSRRRLLTLATGAGLSFGLAACGSTPVTPATRAGGDVAATTAGTAAASGAAGQVRLTAMSWGNATVQKIMQDAAQAFSQQHPGVTVTYINTAGGDAHYSKLETMMAGNDAPSVFYMDPSRMPAYASKGVQGALDPYVKSSAYDLTDFYPKAIGQYYWQGKLYGLPRGFGNQDLYFNTGLFAKSGVPRPPAQWDDPAWSTDEFLARAEKLTLRSGGKVTQFGYGQALGLRQWEPWVWLFGGEVVDKANKKCLLAEAPAMAGLQFLADLMNKYQVMPTPDYTQQQDNASLFASGRIAMNMDIPAALDTYRKLTSITWDVGPLPKSKLAVTSGGGICWAMYGKSDHAEQQWELLGWMAGKEVQTKEAAASATAPARQSVANSTAYDNPKLPPEHMVVFLKAPDYVHLDPQAVQWAAIETLLNKELSFLWDGSKHATDILPDLAPKVTAMLQGKG